MGTIASPIQHHFNTATPLLQQRAELPSPESFVSLVQDCREAKDLKHSQRLHTQICEYGLEALQPVGNYLVPMFVECASLLDAQHVFNKLNHQNEYSWTSLIQGHVESGDLDIALDMLEPMLAHAILPSTHTFVALLKACSQLKNLNRGLQVYHGIVLLGMEAHQFVCNTLVGMFADCGAFAEARYIFDGFADRDVISWTALIALHVDEGLVDEALQSLNSMILEGNSPNAHTFVCCLSACQAAEDTCKVQELHKDIIKQGFEQNTFIGNTLVDIYSKHGLFLEAIDVLNKLQQRDVVTWTALIVGHCTHGHAEEALTYLELMRRDRVQPNIITYVSGLKACGILQAADRGRELHAVVAKLELDEELVMNNALIEMYSMCSLLEEAQIVFNSMPIRNLESWNTIIGQLMEHGHCEEAQVYFVLMQAEGVLSPTESTFVTALTACGLIESIERGFELHSEIMKVGFETEAFVGSALVDMYAKCHMLEEVQYVFDHLPVHDSIIWTVLITGYADHGLVKEALAAFHRMTMEGFPPDSVTVVCCLKACGVGRADENVQELHSQVCVLGLEEHSLVVGSLVNAYCKCGLLLESRDVLEKSSTSDVASWNALIAGYTKQGLADEALDLLENMQQSEGFLPDVVTLVCSLRACCRSRATDKGRAIHVEVVKRGYERVSFIGNTLADLYVKCASLEEAKTLVRDVVSWTSLMAGYWEQGLGEDALRCIEEMQLEGVSPDAITFVCSLKACISSGSLSEGQEVHAEVVKEGFDEDANIASYLVEMYTQCGLTLEAQDVSHLLPSNDDYQEVSLALLG